jgi:hypothetical protein
MGTKCERRTDSVSARSASVQHQRSGEAVQKTGRSSPSARPAGGAAVPTPPGRTQAGSLQSPELRRKKRRPAGAETRSVSHPIQHVISQPADSSAVETLLCGESTEQDQAEQHPSRSAGQARHVVSTQELLPGWEALVHPLGQRDAIRRSGAGCALVVGRKTLRAHKRPSTCGSGRLGLSCHVWRYLVPSTKQM